MGTAIDLDTVALELNTRFIQFPVTRGESREKSTRPQEPRPKGKIQPTSSVQNVDNVDAEEEECCNESANDTNDDAQSIENTHDQQLTSDRSKGRSSKENLDTEEESNCREREGSANATLK